MCKKVAKNVANQCMSPYSVQIPSSLFSACRRTVIESYPGTSGEMNGVVFANLEYYTRLKFPITHSLTLFKERLKANSYLNSNTQTGYHSLVNTVIKILKIFIFI